MNIQYVKVNIRPINSNSLQADLPNGGWRSVRHDSDPMNQLMSCPWVQQSLLGYTTCMELRAKPAKESLGHYSYLGFSYSPSNWWAVILQLLALSVMTRDYRQYPEACNEHLLDAESKRWCMISWCMRSVGKTAFNIQLQCLCTTVHEDVYFENAKNRVRKFNNVELNKSQTRAKDSITRTRCADKVELHSGDGEACEKKPTTTERCNSPAETWKTFRLREAGETPEAGAVQLTLFFFGCLHRWSSLLPDTLSMLIGCTVQMYCKVNELAPML